MTVADIPRAPIHAGDPPEVFALVAQLLRDYQTSIQRGSCTPFSGLSL